MSQTRTPIHEVDPGNTPVQRAEERESSGRTTEALRSLHEATARLMQLESQHRRSPFWRA